MRTGNGMWISRLRVERSAHVTCSAARRSELPAACKFATRSGPSELAKGDHGQRLNVHRQRHVDKPTPSRAECARDVFSRQAVRTPCCMQDCNSVWTE